MLVYIVSINFIENVQSSETTTGKLGADRRAPMARSLEGLKKVWAIKEVQEASYQDEVRLHSFPTAYKMYSMSLLSRQRFCAYRCMATC